VNFDTLGSNAMSVIYAPVPASLAIAWLIFTIWTVYRLGSHDAVLGETTARYGIRGFGLMLWAAMIFVGVYLSGQIDPNRSLWYSGAVFAFVLLPICLWGGYLWGKVMSSLFPRRPDK
jgi:hypothetical protein